ncbi:MAG: transposase zinc-binding domain-containing protein [Gammaproteobacteria bacterium]
MSEACPELVEGCQTLAKERWVEARCAELLPVPYFHVVFTLPHTLNPLAQGNPQAIYRLLFQAAAETLQTFGRDPKWLGGELGITMVLHTLRQAQDRPGARTSINTCTCIA